MADCFENLFVEVNPRQPYPENSSSVDAYLLDVNFEFQFCSRTSCMFFLKSSTDVKWKVFRDLLNIWFDALVVT